MSTTATTKIASNRWYHVAIVKDTASATSGNTKIFLDGKLEATTAVSGTFHNATNPLEIGADRMVVVVMNTIQWTNIKSPCCKRNRTLHIKLHTTN